MMSNLNHTVMVPRTNGVFGLKLKAAETGETIVREHLMYPMIQKGDIIVSVNDQIVYCQQFQETRLKFNEVVKLIGETGEGQPLKLELIRPVGDDVEEVGHVQTAHANQREADNNVIVQIPASSAVKDIGANTNEEANGIRRRRRKVFIATIAILVVLILIFGLAAGLGRSKPEEFQLAEDEGGNGEDIFGADTKSDQDKDDSKKRDSSGSFDSSSKGKWMHCSVPSSCYNYYSGYYESCYETKYVYRPAGFC